MSQYKYKKILLSSFQTQPCGQSRQCHGHGSGESTRVCPCQYMDKNNNYYSLKPDSGVNPRQDSGHGLRRSTWLTSNKNQNNLVLTKIFFKKNQWFFDLFYLGLFLIFDKVKLSPSFHCFFFKTNLDTKSIPQVNTHFITIVIIILLINITRILHFLVKMRPAKATVARGKP